MFSSFKRRFVALAAAMLLLLGSQALADPPAGYYNNAEGKSGDDLRISLTQIISNGYVTLTYNVARDHMYSTIDDQGGNQVQCVYSATFATIECRSENQCANSAQAVGYQAEHTYPQSFFNSEFPMQSDLHHLFPAVGCFNGSRSDLRFGYVTAPASPQSCEPFDVSYRGPSTLDGTTVYQVRQAHRGDTARALLYMIVRYWDQDAIFDEGEGPQDFSPAYINTLIAWHNEDLPDTRERTRNDRVFAVQGNRNPFIDRPEFVSRIWQGGTPSPSPTPSVTPTQSLTPTASATPGGTIQPGEIVINEIDYDDDSADDLSFIELKNVSGRPLTLSDLQLVGTNGTGTTTYFTVTLPAVLLADNDYYVIGTGSESAGLPAGVVDFTMSGTGTGSLQNGPEDGVYLRLTASPATIIDSVSYEGAAAHPPGSPDSGNAGTDTNDATSLSRFPDGNDTNDNAANFFAQAPTPGTGNGAPTPTPTASQTPSPSPTAASPTPSLSPSVSPTEPPTVAPGEVIINEVDYDDEGADDVSFIELRNVSGRTVNLSVLDIVGTNNDGATTYFQTRLPAVELPGGAYFVLGTGTDSASLSELVEYTLPGVASLQNGANDGVYLRLNANPSVIVDSVSYEGAAAHPAGATDSGDAGTDAGTAVSQSLSRYPDSIDTNANGADFAVRPPSPGASNGGAPTLTPTASPTATTAPTATTTATPSASPSASATETVTPTATTAGPSPSATPTGTTAAPTATASPSSTSATPTATSAVTPTAATPTVTDAPTATATSSPSASPSPTPGNRGDVIPLLLRQTAVQQSADINGDGVTDMADLYPLEAAG